MNEIMKMIQCTIDLGGKYVNCKDLGSVYHKGSCGYWLICLVPECEVAGLTTLDPH